MKNLDFTHVISKLNKINFTKNDSNIDIEKSLNEIFSRSFFDFNETNLFLEEKSKTLLDNNILVHKNYSNQVELINKGLTLSLQKNQEQIKIYAKQSTSEISKIQKEFSLQKSKLNKEINELQKTTTSLNEESKKTYEDEVALINNEIKEKSNEYKILNQRIENEKNIKLANLVTNYEDLLKELSSKSSSLIQQYQADLNVLVQDLNKELTIKDDIYLSIKKTHTQSSIRLNNFINKLKEEQKEYLIKNIEKHEALLKEVEEQRLKATDAHNLNKDAILNKHLEKTKALNIVFDVQKDVYNNKTSQIIEKNNQEVTLINQNIRFTRESIEEKIRLLEKEKWNKQSKQSSVDAKASINKEYNALINKLKKDLMSLAYKNRKELSQQEIIFQADLYNHDFEHIKQINEWRYSKNVYDAERKNYLDKEINRYEYIIKSLDKKIELYNQILKTKQEITKVHLSKDVLPIDSQIYFASALQNREINLLNLEFESYKLNNELNQKLLTLKLDLAELELKYQFNSLENTHNYDLKKVNIQYQLEIQSNILKRNHDMGILDLNLKLQKDLLDQKISLNEELLNFNVKKTSYELELINIDFNYQSTLIKQVATIEEKKRLATMQEIKIKNHLQINQAKNQRIFVLSKNNTENRQLINSHFFDAILDIYYAEENIYKLLIQLVKGPTHPDIARQLLPLIVESTKLMHKEVLDILDLYFKNDLEESKKQLETLSEYQYRINHEEIIDTYNDNISILNDRKKELELKIGSVDEEFITVNNKLKQNELLVSVYKKDRSKENRVNSQEHLLILNKEIKELNILIKNTIKLKNNLSSELIPVNNNLNKYLQEKELNVALLNQSIKKEQSQYNNLNKKHLKNYHKYLKTLNKHSTDVIRQYELLDEKTYLNDQSIELVNKRLSVIYSNLYNNLVKNNNKLLSFWLDNYLIHKNDQSKMIESFEQSSNSAIDQIKKNYLDFSTNEKIRKENIVKEFNINTKSLNDNITLLKELNIITNNNIKEAYNSTYENTIKSIETNNSKIKYDLDLLKINLNDVITNLTAKYESNNIKNLKINEKDQNKLRSQILSTENEIESNISRTNLRINLIITKYETDRKNHLKLMNNHRIKYINELDKLNNHIKNLDKNYRNNIIEDDKTSKKLIKDFDQNLKNYIRKSKSDRNKLTRKERKALKKSYVFKAKQIKQEQR